MRGLGLHLFSRPTAWRRVPEQKQIVYIAIYTIVYIYSIYSYIVHIAIVYIAARSGLAATTLNGDAEKSKLNSWLCYRLWSGSEPGSYFHLSVFPFGKTVTRFCSSAPWAKLRRWFCGVQGSAARRRLGSFKTCSLRYGELLSPVNSWLIFSFMIQGGTEVVQAPS